MLYFCWMNLKLFITLVLCGVCFSSISMAGEYKNVVVIKDTTISIRGEYIAEIKFAENGFTTNCSYPEVIQDLKEKADKLGANLIVITRHKMPDVWSSCHRITASAYKVENTRDYENEIEWNRNRKLEWDDFKAEPDSPPMSAQSFCMISYETNNFTLFKRVKYFVKTTFIPGNSWVTADGKQSLQLLKHEQAHFDLWEIYARKFYKELIENKRYAFSIAKVNALLFDIRIKCMKRHDLYDKETKHGTIAEEQEKWNKIIEDELVQLDAYANHF